MSEDTGVGATCVKCLSHKCWTNERCCCCLKCLETQIKQFICYNSVNIVRFILIGALIFVANIHNIDNMDKYKHDCCNCYYISKSPNFYSEDVLSSNSWFDLSICIPLCTSCNKCETYFNHSAQESFSYNYSALGVSYCPLDDYTAKKYHFAWDWNQLTDCKHHHIKITTFFFWARSYKYYIVWAGGIIGLYVTISLVLVCLACVPWCKCRGTENEFSRLISVYNFIISECCLYWLFMPYKFWNKPFDRNIGPSRQPITCPITQVNATVQGSIGIMFIGLAVFVVIHLVTQLVAYCKNCCVKQVQHVTDEQNNRLLASNPYEIEDSKHFGCIRFRAWFGITFGIWILVFLMALLVAICQVLVVDVKHFHDIDDQDIVIIVCGVILIVSAMFDALFTGASRKWLFEYCQHIQGEFNRTCTCCSCCVVRSAPLRAENTELVTVQSGAFM